MLGLAVESLTFLIAFSAIRTFSGGYHCKSATSCYFVSNALVFLILLIIKYASFQIHLYLIMLLVCVSITILTIYAPIETENRPLDEKEQKYFQKKLTNLRRLFSRKKLILQRRKNYEKTSKIIHPSTMF